MKKSLLLAAAAMMALTTVQAQTSKYYDTKHEVGFTIGAGASTEIFSGLSDMTEILMSAAVTSVVTGGMGTGYYSYGDESYIPTMSLEYYYHVNKIVGLGGYLAFNGMDRDMYAEWNNNVTGKKSKEKTGSAKRRNFSIMPTAKFDWLRMKYFGLYSKAGVGLSIMYESQKDETVEGGTDFSDTTLIPNIHATLLGAEFGVPTIRGFLELGMGEQGILLAGLKYKF